MPFIGSEWESIEMAMVYFQTGLGICLVTLWKDCTWLLTYKKHTNKFLWEPSLHFFANLPASVCVFICWGWRIPNLPPSVSLPPLQPWNSHGHRRPLWPFTPDLHPPSHPNLLRKLWLEDGEGRIRRKKSRYICHRGLREFIINRSEPNLRDLAGGYHTGSTSMPWHWCPQLLMWVFL